MSTGKWSGNASASSTAHAKEALPQRLPLRLHSLVGRESHRVKGSRHHARDLRAVLLALVRQRVQEPDPEIRAQLDSLAEKYGIT